MCTIVSQDDGQVLQLVCGDDHQHGGRFAAEEAERHVFPRPAALSEDGRRLMAGVTHHREWLLERVDHRGAALERHGNF